GPRRVRKREPHQRVLPDRQPVAPLERLAYVGPGLVDERPGRAVDGLRMRKLLVKALTFRERAGPPRLLLHDVGQLVEHAAADAARPAGMAHRRETDDAYRIKAAAAQRLLG